jgi:hypothetical protein
MLRFCLNQSPLRILVGGNAPFFGCSWITFVIVGGNAPFFTRFLPGFRLLNGNAPFFCAVLGLMRTTSEQILPRFLGGDAPFYPCIRFLTVNLTLLWIENP